jgi:uncharacterized membrane protein YhfC
MVSSLAIVFMVISLAICILLPVILTVYFYRKYKISLRAVMLGVAVFVVFQMATRIPLLTVLGKQQWYMDMFSNIYAIALFLGLTAGLFEEVGRYIAMKLFMKKSLNWKNAVAFGIGHGGIEAILLVGITMLNNIVMSIMINTGVFDTMVAAQLPPGVADQIKSALINTPISYFLAGGVERAMTMSIQIAFSVMVLYSVKFKKPLYLLYAILLHTIVDSPLVILGSMGLGVWAIELCIFAMAAISFVYIMKAKAIFAEREQEEAAEESEILS